MNARADTLAPANYIVDRHAEFGFGSNVVWDTLDLLLAQDVEIGRLRAALRNTSKRSARQHRLRRTHLDSAEGTCGSKA